MHWKSYDLKVGRGVVYGYGRAAMARIAAVAPSALAVSALAGGCLQPDAQHCANQRGDRSCPEMFCSLCVSKSGGCVVEMPTAACHRPGSTPSPVDASSSSSSGAGSTAGTTADPSSGGLECGPDGDGLDDTCSERTPYCVAGACVACEGDGFCAELGLPPACHPESGTCLACVERRDCTGACDDAYACVECTDHSDCPQTACDLRHGRCLRTSKVFWVDASGCGPVGDPSLDPGFGTEDEPYCWLRTALDNVDEHEVGVVHLRASVDVIEQEIALTNRTGRTVAVLGHHTPRLGRVPTAVSVGSDSTLYVSGIHLQEATVGAARCTFLSTLWLTDTQLLGNAVGVEAQDCGRVTLERSVVAGSRGDAVVAVDTRLSVWSSAIVNNGSAEVDAVALRASEGSRLDVRYSTVALNWGQAGRASVSCTDADSGTIANSVIVSPQEPSFACPGVRVLTSVLDDQPLDFEDVAVVTPFNSAWFADILNNDVSVRDPLDSPFGDVARWRLGDPRRGLSGSRRLAFPGQAEFAGAQQP